MTIFQISVFVIVSTLLIITIKDERPEIAILISIAAGIAVFIVAASYLKGILVVVSNIADEIDLDLSLMGTMLKIVAIAYVSEFTSQICKDAGVTSLASKVELAGKILILFASAPIVLSLLELLSGIV